MQTVSYGSVRDYLYCTVKSAYSCVQSALPVQFRADVNSSGTLFVQRQTWNNSMACVLLPHLEITHVTFVKLHKSLRYFDMERGSNTC